MDKPIDSDPISAKRFFSGIVAPKTGIKALAFLPWLILFLFIGFTIWKAYIKKSPPTQSVVMGSGDLQIVNQASKKWLIWFIEPWVGVSTEQNWDAGLRTGIRLEF